MFISMVLVLSTGENKIDLVCLKTAKADSFYSPGWGGGMQSFASSKSALQVKLFFETAEWEKSQIDCFSTLGFSVSI